MVLYFKVGTTYRDVRERHGVVADANFRAGVAARLNTGDLSCVRHRQFGEELL